MNVTATNPRATLLGHVAPGQPFAGFGAVYTTNGPATLLITGPTGSGKSLLLDALTRNTLDDGHNAYLLAPGPTGSTDLTGLAAKITAAGFDNRTTLIIEGFDGLDLDNDLAAADTLITLITNITTGGGNVYIATERFPHTLKPRLANAGRIMLSTGPQPAAPDRDDFFTVSTAAATETAVRSPGRTAIFQPSGQNPMALTVPRR